MLGRLRVLRHQDFALQVSGSNLRSGLFLSLSHIIISEPQQKRDKKSVGYNSVTKREIENSLGKKVFITICFFTSRRLFRGNMELIKLTMHTIQYLIEYWVLCIFFYKHNMYYIFYYFPHKYPSSQACIYTISRPLMPLLFSLEPTLRPRQ